MKNAVALSTLLLLAACDSRVVSDSDEGSEGGGNAGGASAGGSGAGGQPVDCDPPSTTAVFEIGSGEECFEPLADGATVPLISGPQGGYHLWVAVGCADCAATVSLEWGVNDPVTGETFPNTYPNQGTVPLSSGAWPQAAGLIAGMPGLSWDPENEPPPPPGTHVLLWVKSSGAVEHEAEVEVVIGETVSWDPCAETPDDPACNQLG